MLTTSLSTIEGFVDTHLNSLTSAALAANEKDLNVWSLKKQPW
jgi:hypothetical protein